MQNLEIRSSVDLESHNYQRHKVLYPDVIHSQDNSIANDKVFIAVYRICMIMTQVHWMRRPRYVE